MEAGFGYIEELNLGLSGGSRGGGTLSDILLTAASCLYHLVDGTITPLQKVMSKVKGNIIDTLCLLKGDERIREVPLGMRYVVRLRCVPPLRQ